MTDVSERDSGVVRGLYRSRRGVVLGICRGVGDHFGISVFWFRVLVVAALPFTGVWPVVFVYLVAALLMKPEPIVPFHGEAEAEFYRSYVEHRSMALNRLRRRFERLQRRIERIETTVTSRDYDWERRLSQ